MNPIGHSQASQLARSKEAVRQARVHRDRGDVETASYLYSHALEWLETGVLSSIQVPFGVLDPEARSAIIPKATELGVRVIARGVFAGISLQGATLRPDDDWNSELYASPLTNRQIVLGDTPAPPAAARLLTTLDKYSSRK